MMDKVRVAFHGRHPGFIGQRAFERGSWTLVGASFRPGRLV
jgi:hypothetical protein